MLAGTRRLFTLKLGAVRLPSRVGRTSAGLSAITLNKFRFGTTSLLPHTNVQLSVLALLATQAAPSRCLQAPPNLHLVLLPQAHPSTPVCPPRPPPPMAPKIPRTLMPMTRP